MSVASTTVVADADTLAAFIDATKSAKLIAVDCEGENLSRVGVLTLVQMKMEEGRVFILDMLALKESGFAAIKDILENPSVLKLGYDFRNDHDALFHIHRINTAPLLDMQIVSWYFREKLDNVTVSSRKDWFMKSVQGGRNNWPSLYLPPLKPTGSNAHRHDWKTRPLSTSQLEYAANDVTLIFDHYNAQKSMILSRMAEFQQISSTYFHLYSSLPTRTYNDYECNGIVPMHIFIQPTYPTTICQHCLITIPTNATTKASPNRCFRCWLQGMKMKNAKQWSRRNNYDNYDQSDDYGDYD